MFFSFQNLLQPHHGLFRWKFVLPMTRRKSKKRLQKNRRYYSSIVLEVVKVTLTGCQRSPSIPHPCMLVTLEKNEHGLQRIFTLSTSCASCIVIIVIEPQGVSFPHFLFWLLILGSCPSFFSSYVIPSADLRWAELQITFSFGG